MNIKLKLVLSTMVLTILTTSVTADMFFDNFDSENLGNEQLNYNGFANWTVSTGGVDLIGNGGTWDLTLFPSPGTVGMYLDMDGSNSGAGTITTSLNLSPGIYTLSFDLAGSQRSWAGDYDSVTVGVGSLFTKSYSLFYTDPFTTFTETFTVTTTGSYNMSFAASGNDNVGLLLDNVSLVPVPAATILGILGLSVAGIKLRKYA